MKKSVTLIAGSEETRKTLEKEIIDIIKDININSFSIDEHEFFYIDDNIVILSSEEIKENLKNKGICIKDENIIVAKRTISYDYIDEVVAIPDNTKVLLVNDSKKSSIDCIKNMKDLGINHLDIYPYYPEIEKEYKDISIAITPGELDKIPEYVNTVYNITPRVFDLSTLITIMYKLELLQEFNKDVSYRYLLKIVNMAKRISNSNNHLRNINLHLNTVISGLNKGYLLYDNSGEIKVVNEKLKSIFDIKQKFIIGNKIEHIIKSKKVLNFLYNKGKNRLDSLEYFTKIINIEKVELDNKGLQMAIFECIYEKKNVNKDFLNKGFIAKYNFNDIIGQSRCIKKAKDISKKLASSDLTILIEGESGTGKELFASSIHNSSKRNGGPFLAVNFSALPEDLLESHLFGYEDGAFTGAKKGGKKGLFEEADGGTIFLDEIGDISKKLQTRLLRVLQEKEIMRVGGSKIINIDVRVIAATNKNLEKMVRDNEFREDLYYRLKMGYINIPPLRDRKEDIKYLIKHFIDCEANDNIKIDEDVFNILDKYEWFGNVRELKNMVSYIIAIRESNYININDLPEYILKKYKLNNKINNINKEIDTKNDYFKNSEIKFILNEIYISNEIGEIIGRNKISERSKEIGIDMTISQVRTKLNKLESLGYIVKNKGKFGTKITEKGKLFLNGYFNG